MTLCDLREYTQSRVEIKGFQKFLWEHNWAKRAVFGLSRRLLGLYRIYLEKILHKPKSSHMVLDRELPGGLLKLSIIRGVGIKERELMKKPVVAIANSWSELNPGHRHLRELAAAVKEGILMAGGLAFEFDVPAACDSLGNGNEGMHYILAQRDLIADLIETHVRSQWFDAMVTLSSCDKINPAMLMAAARLDIPTICFPGGFGVWGIRFAAGEKPSIDQADYSKWEDKRETFHLSSCGACEVMGTANTMQCLMEALGMAPFGSAAVPAYHSLKIIKAREAGERIVDMIKENLTPAKIMTRKALENAVVADLAIGGSTNSCLHIPALATMLGLEVKLDLFNQFNKKVPTILAIAPSGPYGMLDLFKSGGMPVVLKILEPFLHLDALTVSGKTLGEELSKVKGAGDEVIRPLTNPFHAEGGTVVLFGNLAPAGAVVKQSAVAKEMLTFEGEALVTDGEDEAIRALTSGALKAGMVLVIRYEGPKGAPGMPELLTVTTMLEALGMHRVALITDGRFSGATRGPCIGHIAPEAYAGGPLAAVRNGDRIAIDIPGRKLEIRLSETEIKNRLAGFKPKEKPAVGYMKRYRAMVRGADEGAVLD